MNQLSLACIILGTCIVVIRSPFMIAPVAAMRWARRISESHTWVRSIGVLVFGLILFLMVTGWNSGSIIGHIIFVLSFFAAIVVTFIFLILPGVFGMIVDYFANADITTIRGTGVIGVIFGGLLIYLGIILR